MRFLPFSWSDTFSFCGRVWGCKPKPPKIPSAQIQPCNDRIQVDDLTVVAKSVMPVQVDVAPRHRRNLLDQCQGSRVTAHLVLGEQPRQDGGVVVDDGVCDQSRALIAALDFDVGSTGQLFLAADLGNG